jgi:hypothetical protein
MQETIQVGARVVRETVIYHLRIQIKEGVMKVRLVVRTKNFIGIQTQEITVPV